MINMITAYTLEVDDTEYALEELMEQLDLSSNLLKYSAGIMHFHTDFIETGVAKEIAEQLNITESTVESQMNKALAFIRKELAEYLNLILILCLTGL